MAEQVIINERLKLYYGCEIDGRPRYQVTWTTNKTEYRFGEFNEFYGNIFLRTTKGVKQVLRYPYDQERWVVEKLLYIRNPELVSDAPGSYEPIYILKDKNGDYLPLNWKVIQVVVDFAEERPYGIKLTDKDWKAEEDKITATEIAYFEGLLEDRGRSALFANENSAFMDSTKVLK